MKITKTRFKDLLVISYDVKSDRRGYFKETFRNNILEKHISYKIKFCQENYVFSKLNVCRGLHFQTGVHSQSKLISIVKGKILDIAADIRVDSETYGQYFAYELSSKKNESIFIPKGFAHGYLSLSPETIICYKVDNYYNPNAESGISYNDDFLNVNWPISQDEMIISEKDKNLKKFIWK